MDYIIGPKGQVIIAKEIRDHLGIEPGWLAIQRLEGDHLGVYFVPPEHRRSLKGQLAKDIRKRVALGKDWEKARDISWEKSARNKIGGRKLLDQFHRYQYYCPLFHERSARYGRPGRPVYR